MVPTSAGNLRLYESNGHYFSLVLQRNTDKKHPSVLPWLHVEWATKVVTLASIRNTWKQGSWLLRPTVHMRSASNPGLFLHNSNFITEKIAEKKYRIGFKTLAMRLYRNIFFNIIFDNDFEKKWLYLYVVSFCKRWKVLSLALLHKREWKVMKIYLMRYISLSYNESSTHYSHTLINESCQW